MNTSFMTHMRHLLTGATLALSLAAGTCASPFAANHVTTQAAAPQPTRLSITVNGVTATATVTDNSHSHVNGALTVGTPLVVRAVTDAPRLPRGWVLHIIRTGERDPKTGGWREICRTRATTCRVARGDLIAAGDETVYAQVLAPTSQVLNAQVMIKWQ